MEFLPTVSQGATPGEQEVWNTLRDALRGEDGLAFMHFPVFPKDKTWRYEPDILLLHRQLGLVVIEVKDCRADNVEALDGQVWRMANWHSPQESPAKQADNQLFALRRYFDGYPNLRDRLRSHALVALPFVTEDAWAAKGFAGLPHNPKIIHQNQLSPARLRRRLYELTRGDTQPLLNDEEWALACQVLGMRATLERVRPSVEPSGHPLVDRIRDSEAAIPVLDLEQLRIGLEVPPGPQRLRGIAGSGKTLLLAMKAARMHLSHPDWDIAFTFNTKSLYQSVRAHITRFCQHFGECEPNWDKLRVLHGWGGKTTGPGLYSVLAEAAGHEFRSVGWAKAKQPKGSPAELLAVVCQDLVDSGRIRPVFDAILIDEGQDFGAEVYRMAYEGLRDPKRLIWAYDEAQSLDTLRIPNAEALFGRDEQGRLRVDLAGYYPGGIHKSRIMRKCYRTPTRILMTAHAFGMGLVRSQGPVQLITTQQGWQDIGYHVEGSFDGHSRPIVLSRPPEHRPHPLDRQEQPPLLMPKPFSSREEELDACVRRLIALSEKGVTMDEVLIVFPGTFRETEAIRRDMAWLCAKLALHGLKAHQAEDQNDAEFRQPGAVTLSRIHRAKGNEAPYVMVLGLDRLAQTEGELESRNQLFVALTRARGCCWLSGLTPAASGLFDEIERILAAGDRLTFSLPGPEAMPEPIWHEPRDPAPVLPFVTHVPLYDLPVAAGPWPGARVPEVDEPGWVDLSEMGKLSPQLFAVRITGDSMAPRIPNGAIAVFQRTDSLPQGKVVLAGMREDASRDDSAWVVKRLVVEHHTHGGLEYCLKSENRDFPDIPIKPSDAERLQVRGVLKWVLPTR